MSDNRHPVLREVYYRNFLTIREGKKGLLYENLGL